MIKSRVVHFLNDSRDIGKDSLVWNMIGSILLGFQSVVFLMVLNRTVGLALAGIFSIAYANANMFLTIGNYGMRYYQVSDVKDRFSFPVYRFSRVVTWTLMIVVSAVYVYAAAARLGYTSYKCAVILGTICFKSVDCIEDVYHGRYQQRGRLDVAAKAQSIRLILTLLVFVLCICLTGNLLLTVLVSMLFTALLCLLLIRWTIGNAAEEKKTGDRPNAFIIKETRSLLLVCFLCSAVLFCPFTWGTRRNTRSMRSFQMRCRPATGSFPCRSL
jgi:O-antigen/teichoic acid export membrane protein